jgi:hypothetical protein
MLSAIVAQACAKLHAVALHRMLSNRLRICLKVDRIKGKAISIAAVVNFIINLFPIELYSLRPSITFIIFAAIFTGSLYFIMRYDHDDKE